MVDFVFSVRTFLPKPEQELMPWCKLLRKDVDFSLTDDHLKSFETMKQDLSQATTATFRIAKPGPQWVFSCGASYYSNGFVLTVEDYLKHKDGTNKQAYAPASFGSQLFNTSQFKNVYKS